MGMNVAGQHEPWPGPVPAHQRLDLGHGAVGELHDGLVVQLELAWPRWPARSARSSVSCSTARWSRFSWNTTRWFAALVLGPVHGDVGVADERLGRHRRVGRVNAMPMLAVTKMLAAVGQHERLAAARSAKRSAAATASRSPREAVAHDHELVAAEAAERLARAQQVPEPLGHLLQHEVADGVALGVVDDLEPVEVDEQHRDAPAPRRRPGASASWMRRDSSARLGRSVSGS